MIAIKPPGSNIPQPADRTDNIRFCLSITICLLFVLTDFDHKDGGSCAKQIVSHSVALVDCASIRKVDVEAEDTT